MYDQMRIIDIFIWLIVWALTIISCVFHFDVLSECLFDITLGLSIGLTLKYL